MSHDCDKRNEWLTRLVNKIQSTNNQGCQCEYVKCVISMQHDFKYSGSWWKIHVYPASYCQLIVTPTTVQTQARIWSKARPAEFALIDLKNHHVPYKDTRALELMLLQRLQQFHAQMIMACSDSHVPSVVFCCNMWRWLKSAGETFHARAQETIIICALLILHCSANLPVEFI